MFGSLLALPKMFYMSQIVIFMFKWNMKGKAATKHYEIHM